MNTIRCTLSVYDGPLDLLLTLIQKNKINIYDIPIAEITTGYLDELQNMREMDLEITGEFLVMASWLLLMKSRALLPRHEETEDDEMTPDELARRLIEYRKVKEAAKELEKHQYSTLANYFKEPEKIARVIPENGSIEKTRLYEAFLSVMNRIEAKLPPPRESFRGIIEREKISLPDKIRDVIRFIRKKKRTNFESFFEGAKSKTEVVTTFLAILHLVSHGRMKIFEKGDKIILVKSGEDNGEE